MPKLICQVLGSPEYCVAVYVDAGVIVAELKEAIQQKVEAIRCPAPLLQLYILRRDNDDGDNQWLDSGDLDLNFLEMEQVPASVMEKYVKPERIMKPRRELNFYFNDANHFDSAAVHMLVQVPHGSETESAAECPGAVREIEIFVPILQDHSMQSVKMETLRLTRKILQSRGYSVLGSEVRLPCRQRCDFEDLHQAPFHLRVCVELSGSNFQELLWWANITSLKHLSTLPELRSVRTNGVQGVALGSCTISFPPRTCLRIVVAKRKFNAVQAEL